MYKFRIFEIMIIFFQKLAILPYFDPIIFIIEITLKLLLHTKYGQNNPN